MLPVILGAATLGYAIYCCTKQSNDEEQTEDELFGENEPLHEENATYESSEKTVEENLKALLSDPVIRQRFKEVIATLEEMTVTKNSMFGVVR